MQVAVSSPRPVAKPAGRMSLGLVVFVGVGLIGCFAAALALDPKIALAGVLAIVGPILVYYVVSQPAIAVCVALASHAWAIEIAGPYVTPFKIAGILAIFVVARDVLQRRRVRPMPVAYTVAIVGLLLIVALGELLAEYESSTAPFFEFAGTLTIYVLASQTILEVKDLRVLSRVYVVNLLLTFLSVVREVGWAGLSDAGTRAVGICGQPNVLGNHLAMSLPFALGLLIDRTESGRWRLLAGVAVLGSAYGEWAAASRGGTIGYIAALFWFALLTPRVPRYRITAVVLAILATAAFAAFSPRSFGRVTETFDGTADVETIASERALHARIGADMLPRHPFLGYGITAFGYERSRYSGSMGGALHSSVLAVAVSYGLPALALYILLQLSGVVVAVRNAGSGPDRIFLTALSAAAVAAITSGLSGTELFRAEQWGLVSLCHIAALRVRLRREAAAKGLARA